MLFTESIRTSHRSQILDLTPRIRDLIQESHIQSGLAVIFIPHTTAAVTINENADPDVKHDLLQKLSHLIPKSEPYYQHGEGNSDSHLKTLMTGPSLTLIIENNDLLLGTWQGVYFTEYDGPRTRTWHLKLVSTP